MNERNITEFPNSPDPLITELKKTILPPFSSTSFNHKIVKVFISRISSYTNADTHMYTGTSNLKSSPEGSNFNGLWQFEIAGFQQSYLGNALDA